MELLERLARWLDSQIPNDHWKDRILQSYCERSGDPGFWAEPFNALTNAAFVIASLAGLALWLRAPGGRRGAFELLLVLIVFLIGLGSFLFHTLANRWSAMADVIPIALFMVLYVAYALRRFAGLPWLLVLAGLAAFFASLYWASGLRCTGGTRCLGGSVAYLPALGALLLVGLVLAVRRHAASLYLLSGSAVFALSLTMRTYDKAWCRDTSFVGYAHVGTHMWWHILNATLLYLLLRAAILHGTPRR